jgi:hypothetical protein
VPNAQDFMAPTPPRATVLEETLEESILFTTPPALRLTSPPLAPSVEVNCTRQAHSSREVTAEISAPEMNRRTLRPRAVKKQKKEKKILNKKKTKKTKKEKKVTKVQVPYSLSPILSSQMTSTQLAMYDCVVVANHPDAPPTTDLLDHDDTLLCNMAEELDQQQSTPINATVHETQTTKRLFMDIDGEVIDLSIKKKNRPTTSL